MYSFSRFHLQFGGWIPRIVLPEVGLSDDGTFDYDGSDAQGRRTEGCLMERIAVEDISYPSLEKGVFYLVPNDIGSSVAMLGSFRREGISGKKSERGDMESFGDFLMVGDEVFDMRPLRTSPVFIKFVTTLPNLTVNCLVGGFVQAILYCDKGMYCVLGSFMSDSSYDWFGLCRMAVLYLVPNDIGSSVAMLDSFRREGILGKKSERGDMKIFGDFLVVGDEVFDMRPLRTSPGFLKFVTMLPNLTVNCLVGGFFQAILYCDKGMYCVLGSSMSDSSSDWFGQCRMAANYLVVDSQCEAKGMQCSEKYDGMFEQRSNHKGMTGRKFIVRGESISRLPTIAPGATDLNWMMLVIMEKWIIMVGELQSEPLGKGYSRIVLNGPAIDWSFGKLRGKDAIDLKRNKCEDLWMAMCLKTAGISSVDFVCPVTQVIRVAVLVGTTWMLNKGCGANKMMYVSSSTFGWPVMSSLQELMLRIIGWEPGGSTCFIKYLA